MDRRKKVMILASLPPQRGGVSQHVHNLLSSVDKKQFEIFALTYWQCEKGESYDAVGFAIYHLPTFFLPDRVPLLRGFLYLFFGLVWGFFLIKRERIDFIHAHVIMPQGLLAYLLKRITGVKYLYTAHGAPLPLYWEKGWPFQMLIKKTVKEAEIVTSVCQRNHNFLKGWNKNCVVVPNGINDDFVDQFFRGAEKVGKEGDDRVRILFVGRVNEYKGIDLLISATEEIVERGYRNIMVELIGGGSPRLMRKFEGDVRRRNLEKYIYFSGIKHDVPSRLRRADIFVLPSRLEGLPTTILEALVLGVPVVASNVGGIPDIIQNGKNGLLVPPEDVKALSQAIMRLIDEGGLRKRLILEGYRTVPSYRWSRIARQYSSLYAKITNGETGQDGR